MKKIDPWQGHKPSEGDDGISPVDRTTVSPIEQTIISPVDTIV